MFVSKGAVAHLVSPLVRNPLVHFSGWTDPVFGLLLFKLFSNLLFIDQGEETYLFIYFNISSPCELEMKKLQVSLQSS